MPVVLFSEEGGLGDGDPVIGQPGTGTSIPFGLEAHFRYNGLTLNDRSVVDKYRIISIDGLDDPDIRDSREENPAYHGETPYGSFYGGRTLAMNGRIEAYSIHKLRDMQQALRASLVNLHEELPLYFLTGDPSVDHFINCKKFSKNQWGEEQRSNKNYFRDFLITFRASNPRFLRNNSKTVTFSPSQEAQISNVGNFFAEPIIRLTGPLNSIGFNISYPDGEQEYFALKSSVIIGAGQYYQIDIARNSIVDQTGANKFPDLDFDSDWIHLHPGTTTITNDSTSGSGTISFTYRDTWI